MQLDITHKSDTILLEIAIIWLCHGPMKNTTNI